MGHLSDNFDEILFRNRNTVYGAYVFRRNYNKRLFISVLIAAGFFVILFVIPFVYMKKPETVLKESPVYSDYFPIPPKEIIEPDELILPELKRIQNKAAFTAPQVVINADEKELSDLNTEDEKSDTTLNGSNPDGSSAGVLDGTGSKDDPIYTYVQEQPMFPGGDAARKIFIQRNLTYPKLAINNKIQGVVYTSFIVEKDGTLSNIKVLQGIGAGCDDEALRVIRMMPRWKPGKRQGHEVRVQVQMPLKFILPSKN